MALTWDTSELVQAIRDKARVADDDPEASDAILLRAATRIMHDTIVPAVRLARSDYYLAESRVAMERGKQAYAIPRRATTSSVRRVRFADASGREWEPMPCSVDDIPVARSGQTGTPRMYAIADDRVVVWPPPPLDDTYYLRIAFEYRPAQLIPFDDTGATYTRVVRSSYGVVTAGLHTLEAEHDLFTDDSVIDIVRANPPFASPVMDATIDAIGLLLFGYGITIESFTGLQTEDLDLIAGDYVCNAGESPVPQIPPEVHPVLALYTASEYLDQIDPQGAAALRADAEGKMAHALKIMAPRKQGAGIKMRPRVRHVATAGAGWRGRGTFDDLS